MRNDFDHDNIEPYIHTLHALLMNMLHGYVPLGCLFIHANDLELKSDYINYKFGHAFI